ncbi:MAG: hypothetical protein ACLP5H_26325 [Desulfomonilaceae bacterium]
MEKISEAQPANILDDAALFLASRPRFVSYLLLLLPALAILLMACGGGTGGGQAAPPPHGT